MRESLLPLVIFGLTYLVIAVGKMPWLRLDRSGAAFAGAVAMVVTGCLSERAAVEAIDYRTLGLLLGMMIVVANLRLSGAFATFARALLLRARSGQGLLALTVVVSGVLAAFFINDVVCLALAPLLADACELVEVNPVPLMLALATASNIGSVATITGNPQNMIVAGFAHLGYAWFAAHLAPVAVVGLAIDYAVIAVLYRGQLGRLKHGTGLLREKRPRTIRPLMLKSSAVALGAFVCFAAGFPTEMVALGAGAVLLFTRRIRPERVFRMVDWTMLVMFAGLFVVVAGAEATGLPNRMLAWVGAARMAHPVTLSVVTALLSNLVSNVPAVLLFRPLYPILGGSPRIALLIASASTLAGNLTVVGSIANLIVIEQAKAHKIRVSYSEYMRVGVPVTLLTLAVSVAALSIGP
jgi:Na+/H+ antiporter NhaD/arsenite permease-like protein